MDIFICNYIIAKIIWEEVPALTIVHPTARSMKESLPSIETLSPRIDFIVLPKKDSTQ